MLSAKSPAAPAALAPVVIRNGGQGIALTGLKLAMGCFGVWLVVWRPDKLWLGLAVAVLGFGFALFELAQFANRQVMLTLTERGLIDHRQTPPVEVPWQAIARVEQGGIGASVAPFLQMRRNADDAITAGLDKKYFRIDCEFLELSPRAIAEHMRRFSPNLDVDMGMLSTLRGANTA